MPDTIVARAPKRPNTVCMACVLLACDYEAYAMTRDWYHGGVDDEEIEDCCRATHPWRWDNA